MYSFKESREGKYEPHLLSYSIFPEVFASHYYQFFFFFDKVSLPEVQTCASNFLGLIT